MAKSIAPRFGIGEWYGHSFVRTTHAERQHFAGIAVHQTKANAPLCPFKPETEKTTLCTKKGGICSLRLYEAGPDGSCLAVTGPDGKLRVTCPHRFKQNKTIYKSVATTMLGTDDPKIATEVRFLQRQTAPDIEPSADMEDVPEDDKSEDVGNIDVVLVNTEKPDLDWCALEIQAVYFSGEKMKLLFEHVRDYTGPGIPLPDRIRRPDYRSSGPKRLMPQLQIKVPTLRRWGKKMAVVVDVPWFRTNVVGVETVGDLSNADIAWFLVDFDEATDPATLLVTGLELQTLERAVEGLTGGFPVTLSVFEHKILAKLAAKPAKVRRNK